ncbi:MAG: hypothetical protein JNM26_08975 [Ideonella sp.]|nr:hypothetical protein [Ideonella sp.]
MSHGVTTGPDAVPARLPPRVLALIGERLAVSAAMPSGAQAPGQSALEELHRLGLQLQQVARLLAHEGREPLEIVDLGAACRQVVSQWQRRADAAGVALALEVMPLNANVHAAALALVLDLLVDHGVAVGQGVRLATGPAGGQAQLRVEVRHRAPEAIAVPSTPSDADGLPLVLARLVAGAHGLALSRSTAGGQTTLVLGVPMFVLDPVTPEEVAVLPRTPSPAGARVLIVDPRPSSRVQAHQLLHEAGIRVDAVESVAQAQVALRDGHPDVLVVGLSSDEAALATLIDEIRAGFGALRVIELVDEDNAFALAPPGANAPGRLSRSELAEHLTAAVAQEMYAARGT